MTMWHSISGVTPCGSIVTHIVPGEDLYPHELSADCWCGPDLDHEFWIATHRSADGREDFESGRRKPS